MAERPLALVGVVDDHPTFRRVLCETVDQASGVRLAWQVEDGVSALHELSAQSVDLVLVDLSLAGMSGIELVRRLSADHPDVVSIVVSGHTERAYVQKSLRAGAVAFVLRGRPAELRDGIRAALNGERYVSPALTVNDL